MSVLQNLRTVALTGNPEDARVMDCVGELIPYLTQRGLRVLLPPGFKAPIAAGMATARVEEDLARDAQLLIAIGGDGTLLRAARLIEGQAIPLLGINHGRLGFLTDISPKTMLADVGQILEGEFIEDPRALLEVRLIRGDVEVGRGQALNDVVIQKVGTGRILDYETAIGGRFVNAHRGDGLIISTATGSTAYALSCNGPIVVPDLDVWVIAPICPHTLSDRPLVVSARSGIEVRLTESSSEVQIVCDGVVLDRLSPMDRIVVERAAQTITLLHPPDYDYFALLRSKLHWGRGR